MIATLISPLGKQGKITDIYPWLGTSAIRTHHVWTGTRIRDKRVLVTLDEQLPVTFDLLIAPIKSLQQTLSLTDDSWLKQRCTVWWRFSSVPCWLRFTGYVFMLRIRVVSILHGVKLHRPCDTVVNPTICLAIHVIFLVYLYNVAVQSESVIWELKVNRYCRRPIWIAASGKGQQPNWLVVYVLTNR